MLRFLRTLAQINPWHYGAETPPITISITKSAEHYYLIELLKGTFLFMHNAVNYTHWRACLFVYTMTKCLIINSLFKSS